MFQRISQKEKKYRKINIIDLDYWRILTQNCEPILTEIDG